MKISVFAGKPAEACMPVDVPKLVSAYYTEAPDPEAPEQRIASGVSACRGSSLDEAFSERHILADSRAIR